MVCYFYPILTKLYLKIQVRSGGPIGQPPREKQGIKGLTDPVLSSVMTLQNVGKFTPIDSVTFQRRATVSQIPRSREANYCRQI
jgi:hypothetical protein